jgi:hypothetical protein
MDLLYDGKVIGGITTNQSLTLEDCFELLGINIDEMEDENTPKWDYDLFEMDYDVDIHDAAATLGARGGAVGGLSTSPAKQAASRTNGRLGGRPTFFTYFREGGFGRWEWSFDPSDGYYDTNPDGEGLFFVTPNGRKQLEGTCDFRLSSNRTLAMAQARRYHRRPQDD